MTHLEYLVKDMENSLKNIKEYIKKGEMEFATSTLLSFADEVVQSGDCHELLMEEY
jgi:hypothetical protein